jgi:hypothetical protein
VWEGRTGAGSGKLPPSRWPQANRNNAHNCTPATLSLNPTHKPVEIGGHARWLFGLVQPRAAPVAADALCRAGWPSPRLPASTARGCFHASTQPRQLPGSILFGSWPAAIDTYATTRVVVGFEGLGAAGAYDRGQLQHRPGHPDPSTAATGVGQRVAGPAQPDRAGLFGATPQHQRRRQLGQHLGVADGGGVGDASRRPANRVQVGHLQAELAGQGGVAAVVVAALAAGVADLAA